MIDIITAKEMVENYVNENNITDDKVVVIDDETIEREFGWIFFCNSSKYLETKEIMYMRFGTRPILVNRLDGTLQLLNPHPSVSIEEQIKSYEMARKHNSKE
jgi:hypothetical protein